MATKSRVQKIKRVLGYRQPDLTVVVENIHDPHNVSAILRTCDAAGIAKVHLVYDQDSFPDLSKKSSASAIKWVETVKHSSIETCYESLHDKNYQILATAFSENAVDAYLKDYTCNTAFVLGNEHRGVSEKACSLADGIIMIPMFGMIQSLNVSVATSVLVFEAVRQRQAKGYYDQTRLDPESYEVLFQNWTDNFK